MFFSCKKSKYEKSQSNLVTFSRILLLLLNLSRKLWYMKDEENLAMIVKFVKYLIDKDVLDKQ